MRARFQISPKSQGGTLSCNRDFFLHSEANFQNLFQSQFRFKLLKYNTNSIFLSFSIVSSLSQRRRLLLTRGRGCELNAFYARNVNFRHISGRFQPLSLGSRERAGLALSSNVGFIKIEQV